MSKELARIMRKSPAARIRAYKKSGRMFADTYGTYVKCPNCGYPVKEGRDNCLECDHSMQEDKTK